ncbi:low molecular weight protein-tyrosine-phosphatase [Lentibacillus saliphilus]|uniref:low molecular weight protein-tyrosine-phosphatase n=1 Tax=Lentibacillus saliphilus TaxID=2737028 RepID=UPI001C300B28
MIRILFVCLGNICRSPMAESVCRDVLAKEGLAEQVVVDSAGTGDWHIGESPHKGTRHILDQHNMSYEGMQARVFAESDWEQFDYVIAMDAKNIADLEQLRSALQNVFVARLMDFVKTPKKHDIPDPYFTGDFNETFELIHEGCTGLIRHIKDKHDL